MKVMNAMTVTVMLVALVAAGLFVHAEAAQSTVARLLAERDCSGCDLSNADLSGVDLDSVRLYRANLSGANLSNANLNGADLTGANLVGADLSGTNFNLATLEGAETMDNLGQALTNSTTTCPDGNAGPCQ